MPAFTNPADIVAFNLRREMDARGLTQQGLAELSGVPQPMISRLLHERRDSRIGTIDRVARALGLPLQALLMQPLDQPEKKSEARA